MNAILIDMLGHPTDSLDHPMWADVHVINGFERATITVDGRVCWRGIVPANRIAKLDELESMDLGMDVVREPLTS